MNGRWTARRLLSNPLLPPGKALAGIVLLLLAERAWPGTPASPYLAAIGAAGLVAALVLHLPPFMEGAAAGLRSVYGWLAAPYALLVAAVGGYFAAGALPSGGAVDWADLARASWMLSALAGTVLLVFVTLARLSQGRVPGGDPRRIRLAGAAGLSLALLAVVVVLANLIFARLPWQWNLAYFKITQPSEATQELAATAPEGVEVGVFFAADSEVGPLMRGYFEALVGPSQGKGPLAVRYLDAHLNPAEAETFKVRDNGWVALRKGTQVLPMQLGEQLEQARNALRTFDRTFYTKLVELSRPKAVVYLSAGHGERTERGTPAIGAAQGEQAFNQFRRVLIDRNYTVKDLGLSDGLGQQVPEDAALVVVAAPRLPFLADEAAALRQYLERGGRVLAFLEPTSEVPGKAPVAGGLGGISLAELLREYGVGYAPAPLANDRFYARRTHTQADRGLLVTAQYQAHPATANLRRTASQFPLLLLGAAGLSVTSPPASVEVKPMVEAMPGTWADLDGNFQFDGGREQRSQPALAVAVSRRSQPDPAAAGEASNPAKRKRPPRKAAEPMLVAFGDADMAADLLLPYRANRLALEDTLAWLVAQDTVTGLPASEEDVPIQHARSDDWLWFYLPVLGVPFAVLAFGIYRVSRRRRRGGGDA